MRCSKCGADNRDTARFCNGCGAPVQTQCPSCGALGRPRASFCDACGWEDNPARSSNELEAAESSLEASASAADARMLGIGIKQDARSERENDHGFRDYLCWQVLSCLQGRRFRRGQRFHTCLARRFPDGLG